MIDWDSFKSTEERIKLAVDLTSEIDEINEINDTSARQKRLMQLKPKFDTMLNSVINEKMHMEWPAAKRKLKIFYLLKVAIAEYFFNVV